MRHPFLLILLLLAAALWAPRAQAAHSFDACTGYITNLPATVSTPGTWCLRQNLSTVINSGAAITVGADNVTIDCNDFEIAALGGAGSQANGIEASGRVDDTVRHCHMRGFLHGISLHLGITGTPVFGGHLVEDNTCDGNLLAGISVSGDGSIVRRNVVLHTGGSTVFPTSAVGIGTGNGVDILDNTVSGVEAHATPSNGFVMGISADYSTGSTVRGNRVRGLVTDSTNQAYAIYVYGSDRVSLRNNDLVGDTGSQSLGHWCKSTTDRVRDSQIEGFTGPMDGCSDTGGNDITP